MLLDLRVARRRIARYPGRSLTAVATMGAAFAVGIALFAIVYSVILSPLPYRDADRLYLAGLEKPRTYGMRIPGYVAEAWRAESTVVSALGMARSRFAFALPATGETISAYVAGPDYFETLGVKAARGRLFLPEEHTGGARSVLLTAEYLRRLGDFDGDPVGQTVRLGEESYTVVGVLPEGFLGHRPIQSPLVWLPAGPEDLRDEKWGWPVAARLTPAATPEQARDELTAMVAGFAEQGDVRLEGYTAELTPIEEGFFSNETRESYLLFLAVLCATLLLAAVNVSQILLAQYVTRAKEIGVRAAIGGRGWAAMSDIVVESVLLATAGWALGLAGATVSLDVVISVSPLNTPRFQTASITAEVVAASLAVAVGLGLLCGGLVCAVFVWRGVWRSPQKVLAGGAGAVGGRAGVASALVVGQIALSLPLVALAGQCLNTYRLVHPDREGLELSRLAGGLVTIPGLADAGVAESVAIVDRLRAGLAPGVGEVAASTSLPMAEGVSEVPRDLEVVGLGPLKGVFVERTSANYFDVLGLRLSEGRAYQPGECDMTAVPFVVNESFARRLGGESALGRAVRFGAWVDGEPKQASGRVVGVAPNVRAHTWDLDEDPKVYAPACALGIRHTVELLARPRSDVDAAVGLLRSRLLELEPLATVPRWDRLDKLFAAGSGVSLRRFQSLFAGAAALLGLGIAAAGVFGAVGYLVSERRREIAIRIAIGAEAGDVRRIVLAHTAKIVACGVALGAAASYLGREALTAWVGRLVGGLEPWIATAAAALAIAGVAAAARPTVRATQVAPADALRAE